MKLTLKSAAAALFASLLFAGCGQNGDEHKIKVGALPALKPRSSKKRPRGPKRSMVWRLKW